MCSSVFRRREKVLFCLQEKRPGALLFQEKGSGALLFSEKRKLVLYCSCFQEKGTGALLFSVEG